MNLKTPLLIIACLAFFFTQAQTVIEGVVKDDQGQPLSGVSVSLLKQADSTLIKIIQTKSDGKFRMPLTDGNLMIKFTSVGHQTVYHRLDAGTKAPAEYIMKRNAKELSEVQVRAARPLYQFLPDKIVMNIDAAPSNAGSNLLEVLNKIPDLVIDQDGNITLNGKPGVMVMIDGRETFVSGRDLVNMLRNMPAAASDQVEIISNPSTKYDATATGGILNIKSKKMLYQGLNGTLSSATGMVVYNDVDGKDKIEPTHNTTLNWNYRKNNINLYGNASYDHSFYFENFRTTRYFFYTPSFDPAGSYFSWSHIKTPDNTYSLRAALDITLDKNNLLGFITNSLYSRNRSRGATNSHVSDNDGKIAFLMRSTIENPGGNFFNGNYNINHKFTDPKKRFELLSDASLLIGSSNARTINETGFFDTLGKEVQPHLSRRQTAETEFTGLVIKSDVTLNSWLKAKWEAGYKYTYIQTISSPTFLRRENGDFVVDGGRTNYFRYRENIYAAYANMTRSLKKTSLQAGLRLEHATGDGYQQLNDSSFRRSWLSLFPSVFLQHQVNKNYQVILNYSRKIRRPSASNLNPFTYFTDSLYSNSGNPFIQPHFSHNFELRHIIRNKYSITLAATLVNNTISMVVNHDPVFKLTRVRIQNFNRYHVVTLSAAMPVRISKWWQANLAATVGANQSKGNAFGMPVKESSTFVTLNAASNFTLSRSWSADANLMYATPQLNGLLIFTRPLNYSLGIRKSLKNNKGSISFSSTVPLFIPQLEFDAQYANTKYHSRFSTGSQTYRLTLSLRFGKQTVPQQRAKKNATDEEQSRM